jgi:hypothetical protein
MFRIVISQICYLRKIEILNNKEIERFLINSLAIEVMNCVLTTNRLFI